MMSDRKQKPFNDAVDHLNSIEGFPTNKPDLNMLPKFLRYFGYFFVAFFSLSVLMIIIGIIFT